MSQESIKILVPALRIRRVVERILFYTVAVLLTVMSVVVFANVIFRYFLNAALGWYEELSRFLLIWIVFLGAVIAYIKGDHLSLDVVLIYLKPKVKHIVILIADLLVVYALIVMTQGGWEMAIDSLNSGWIASTIPIPYGYVYMVGPVSSALMLFQVLIKTIEDWHAFKKTVKGGA